MTIAELSARPTMSLPESSSKAPPTEFRILRAGLNRTEKGSFLFDDQAAASVMAAYVAKGLDKLQIDFEHQSLQPPPGGGPAHKPAAGWFRPEVRDGELWATAVTWTTAAADMLAPASGAPSYRYFSPLLRFDEDTRRVTGVKNLALTNDPAMDEIHPLVAASAALTTHRQEDPMLPKNDSQVALTDADRTVARHLGTDLVAYEAWKIQQAEDKQFEQPGMVALSAFPGHQVELTAADIKLARLMGNSLRDYMAHRLQQQADEATRRRLGLPAGYPLGGRR